MTSASRRLVKEIATRTSTMSSQEPTIVKKPLSFEVIAECETTKARTGRMVVVHHHVDTPVFMPVGTQGTLKGLLPQQLEQLGCQIMLSNTYHLGTRPGPEILKKAGGLHKFMNWNRALLTDSGGFQMVSLLKLAKITEQGVKFTSPYDASECMLTPEHSIEIQNAIGADIVMQLDDVISSTTTGPRVKEAMERTTRWLDRCLAAHQRPEEQSIFPIVQGALNAELRTESAKRQSKREVNGFAIGGLSGGESKNDFWRMVHLSTDILPKNKPRYLMGVGFAVDLVVCSALGVDMYDCVFPTRTARFGCALVRTGQLNLRQRTYANEMKPIDENCDCSTCKTYTRAYLHCLVTTETVACHLLTVHNIAFQMRLMRDIRDSIREQRFPQFVKDFMLEVYADKNYPQWIVEALGAAHTFRFSIVYRKSAKELQISGHPEANVEMSPIIGKVCSNHIETLKKYLASKRDIADSLIVSDGCRSLCDAFRDIDVYRKSVEQPPTWKVLSKYYRR